MSLNSGSPACELFAGLDAADMSAIAEVSAPLEAAAGDVLFREGDEPDGLYVLDAGRVSVQTGGEPFVRESAVLGPGQAFGEMALLLDGPRCASVVATEPCRLRRIDRTAFGQLLDAQDRIACRVLFNLARLLCLRLRDRADGGLA